MLTQTYNLNIKYNLYIKNIYYYKKIFYTHTHTHTYIFVFIKLYCTSHHMYLCTYVCMYVRITYCIHNITNFVIFCSNYK